MILIRSLDIRPVGGVEETIVAKPPSPSGSEVVEEKALHTPGHSLPDLAPKLPGTGPTYDPIEQQPQWIQGRAACYAAANINNEDLRSPTPLARGAV